jgi:hypothetical protein
MINNIRWLRNHGFAHPLGWRRRSRYSISGVDAVNGPPTNKQRFKPGGFAQITLCISSSILSLCSFFLSRSSRFMDAGASSGVPPPPRGRPAPPLPGGGAHGGGPSDRNESWKGGPPPAEGYIG